MIALRVAAVHTAAFSSAYSSVGETLTVEFEALGSLACAFSCNSRTSLLPPLEVDSVLNFDEF